LKNLTDFIQNYSKNFLFSFFSFSIFEEIFLKQAVVKISTSYKSKYTNEEEKYEDFEKNLEKLGFITFFLATGDFLNCQDESIEVNNIFSSLEIIDFINNISKKAHTFKDYKSLLKLPFLNFSPDEFTRVNLKRVGKQNILTINKDTCFWKNFSFINSTLLLDEYYFDPNTQGFFEFQYEEYSEIKIEEKKEEKIDKDGMKLVVNPDFPGDFTFNDTIAIHDDYLERIYQRLIEKPQKKIEIKEPEIDINVTFFIK
jgi:hypothetical protein